MEYKNYGKKSKCEKIKSTLPGFMKKAHRSKEWKRRWKEINNDPNENVGEMNNLIDDIGS